MSLYEETSACPECGASMQGNTCWECGHTTDPNATDKAPEHDVFETALRDSRVYVHSKCGQPTRIHAKELSRLADPYQPLIKLKCSQCGLVLFRTIAWEDTGETINAYRRRIRKNEPKSYYLPYWAAMYMAGGLGVLGLILGAVVAGASGAVFLFLLFGVIGAGAGSFYGRMTRGVVFQRALGFDPRYIT